MSFTLFPNLNWGVQKSHLTQVAKEFGLNTSGSKTANIFGLNIHFYHESRAGFGKWVALGDKICLALTLPFSFCRARACPHRFAQAKRNNSHSPKFPIYGCLPNLLNFWNAAWHRTWGLSENLNSKKKPTFVKGSNITHQYSKISSKSSKKTLSKVLHFNCKRSRHWCI